MAAMACVEMANPEHLAQLEEGVPEWNSCVSLIYRCGLLLGTGWRPVNISPPAQEVASAHEDHPYIYRQPWRCARGAGKGAESRQYPEARIRGQTAPRACHMGGYGPFCGRSVSSRNRRITPDPVRD